MPKASWKTAQISAVKATASPAAIRDLSCREVTAKQQHQRREKDGRGRVERVQLRPRQEVQGDQRDGDGEPADIGNDKGRGLLRVATAQGAGEFHQRQKDDAGAQRDGKHHGAQVVTQPFHREHPRHPQIAGPHSQDQQQEADIDQPVRHRRALPLAT